MRAITTIKQTIERLPEWLQAAVTGMLILLIMGPIVPLVVLPIMGIVQWETKRFSEAVFLFITVVIGGGCPGIVFYITTSLQRSGLLGKCLAWMAIMVTYLLTVWACILTAVRIDARLADDKLPPADSTFVWFLIIVGVAIGTLIGIWISIIERWMKRRQRITAPPG